MSAQHLDRFLNEHVNRTIAAYQAQPALIEEHWNDEQSVISGGYGHRQVIELIQNGADEIKREGTRGKVHIVLTDSTLYCANEGRALNEDGLEALLMARMSRKAGEEIGRFGLGFKSVLKVTDSPEFFSESISLRFGGEEFLTRIREIAFCNGRNKDAIPQLRTAELCSLEHARSTDHILSSLLDWATTVIRIPLRCQSSILVEEAEQFPSEFLLFSPHVSQLRFRLREDERDMRLEQNADVLELIDSDETPRRFKVFNQSLKVSELSDSALADMDERLKRRDTLPISWAVPVDGSSRERGKFWAFFPTQSLTAVQGIINAPWKTNSDRQNLVEEGGNEFNAELARHVAKLIADNLVQVASETDPAKHIDVLPLVDTNGKTDELLVGEIKRMLRRTDWLPNHVGDLLNATTARLRPSAIVKVIDKIADLVGNESRTLVSASADTDIRRKTLARYQISEMGLAEWLEGLEYDSPIEFSRSALQIADILLEHDEELLSKLKVAKIVLTENGELVAPDSTNLVLPSERDTDGVSILCEQLAADKPILRILQKRFSIESATANSAFLAHASNRSSISQWPKGRKHEYWERFWQLLRCVDSSATEIREICLDAEHPLHVKSLTGSFESVFQCVYLPGLAELRGIDRARARICDEEYHQEDFELFEELQIVGFFKLPNGASPSDIYDEYNSTAVEKYRAVNKGAKQASGCKFRNTYYHAGIGLIKILYGDAAVLVTEEIAKLSDYKRKWTMFYDRATAKVGEQSFPSPLMYATSNYGTVQTSLGPRKLRQSISSRYAELSGYLPVVNATNKFTALISDDDSILKQIIEDIFSYEPSEPPADSTIGNLYGLAASIGQNQPDEVWAECCGEWTLFSPKEVFVVADNSQMEILESQNLPKVLCRNSEHRAALCNRWSLREPLVDLRFDPCDSSVHAKQLFPPLANHPVGDIMLQPCTRIVQEFRSTKSGLLTTEVAHGLQGDVVYYVATPDQSLTDLLDILQTHFRDADLVGARDHVDSLHVEKLKLEIKQTTELTQKVLLAVGEENLARNIPSRHLTQFDNLRGESPTSLELAAISIAVYGSDILKRHSDALISRGLNAPRQWAGRTREREFVSDLGFPDSFAGASRSERPACEDVSGPVVLNPLHDFQKRMKSQVLKLLDSPQPARAALSLPTGAGKTRLAVQSAIEWIRSRSDSTQILWVAQSDELCEQAVQTWKQAWSALGTPSKPMRVCRFWGSTGSQVQPPDEHCVVVGTYHTLRNRLDEDGFAWVYDKTQFVIIDEAHGAIAPSYTAILKRLGIFGKSTRIPLLGLTATPFRGSDNAEDSFRLAFRFNKRLLTSGFPSNIAFHQYLQEQGIIADVEHDVLEGASLDLNEEELKDFETFDRLPSSAEVRLANDSLRNERIVKKVLSLPSDWPILLFAASREHAEDLAVRLSVEGVSARCVSGESSINQRRSAVEDFNSGKIRVLTNYGVLTTGFDAPAVRAVLIARPIFSKVLYQQVIGRGLRGPENGGKEKCLIVNVSDNVAQYGHKLAFESAHYWDSNPALQH